MPKQDRGELQHHVPDQRSIARLRDSQDPRGLPGHGEPDTPRSSLPAHADEGQK